MTRYACGPEDGGTMEPVPGLPFSALSRNGFVLVGLLLLGVGLGDAVAGRIKLAQYQAIVRAAPAATPRDPTALFATASEGHERDELARAKLGFYQLLFTAGQMLSALGFVLLVTGVVQLRLRTPRGTPPSQFVH